MNLSPEHKDDLRKSGLSDNTISAMKIESVRPHDIKQRGVESAYSIPYFNLDGTRNDFERRRLFGGDQRYWQPPDSGVELYIPPITDWKPIAPNSSIAVTFTEGEKKSACLSERGIPTLGVGGVWNWQDHIGGDRFMVPVLTNIVWKGRHVELVADSDAWQPDKLLKILGGLYALGMWLVSQGANVCFVRLHDIRGLKKVGADDFIVAHGETWREAWENLERIPISDRRLDNLAAWYQKWREKQVTQEALREQVADDLTLTTTAGLHTVHSSTHGLTITFDRLTTKSSGIIAEVSVVVGTTELRSGIDLNLKSDSTQARLAGSLKALGGEIPWKILIPRACALVLKRYREGAPVLRLDRHARSEPLTYVVNPLVHKRKPTVVFGHGGLGKSTLALGCTIIASMGGTIAGISAVKGRSLYLDWEDSEDVHLHRLHALQAGHSELAEGHVLYLRCTERLSRMVHELVRLIQREQITFLVIDSLLAAAGGGSDAEATQEFFSALRVLDVATLVIGHTPKTLAEGQETATIYGSVFNSNFARSVWELQAQQDIGEDCSTLALIHRKSNLSRLHPPIGLTVQQSPDGSSIRYEPCDLNHVAAMAKALPLPSQIRNLLEDGTLRTSKQVAEALGAKLPTVKATLSKYNKIKWCLVGSHGEQEAKWTVLHS